MAEASTEDTMMRQKLVYKSSVCIIPPNAIWPQIQAIRKDYDPGYVRWMPHINMLYPFFSDDEDGEVFKEAADRLTRRLSALQPFKVKFNKDSFNFFSHKKYCTLWLKPLAEKYQPKAAAADDDVREADEDAGATMLSKKEKKKQMKEEKSREFNKRRNAVDSLAENHAQILNLFAAITEVFPQCNEQTKLSEDQSYHPHLSLGQFPHKDIENRLDEFKQNWVDVEFDLDEIYLISRKDFDDPFQVRHAVKLGKS